MFVCLQAESKRSENVESNSESKKDTNKREAYYDKAEAKKQGKLWRDAEKKKPWYDAPAKVKVRLNYQTKLTSILKYWQN